MVPPSFSQAYSSSADALPAPTATSRSSAVPSGARTSTTLANLPEKSATGNARSSVLRRIAGLGGVAQAAIFGRQHEDAAFLRRGEFGEGDGRSSSVMMSCFRDGVSDARCATFGRFPRIWQDFAAIARHMPHRIDGDLSRQRPRFLPQPVVNHLSFALSYPILPTLRPAGTDDVEPNRQPDRAGCAGVAGQTTLSGGMMPVGSSRETHSE